jgi:hypothetical protein
VETEQKPLNTVIILICWALPLAWVAALQRDGQALNALEITQEILRKNEIVIRSFAKEYNAAPRSMSELRAYGKTKGLVFSSWDGFAQRFEYMRLDRLHWFIRSFAGDGKQSTVISKPDAIASSLGEKAESGITHQYVNHAIRFNPLIRTGAFSTDGKWHAEVVVDHVTGANRLVVQNQEIPGYFIVADHDAVEEFYWVPDGYRIVFSAAGSNRYQDGIYSWDLLTDETRNVFPGSPKLGMPANDGTDQKWHISLSGFVASPPTVLAFATPKNGNSLALDALYSEKTFIGLEFQPGGAVRRLDDNEKMTFFRDPLQSPWLPTEGIDHCEKAPPDVSSWCSLGVAGTFQSVLGAWQAHAEKAGDTALFPYALFYLIGIYSDTFSLVSTYAAHHHEDTEAQENSEILRSYGTELAAGLANLLTAPTWLRAVGLGAHGEFSGKRSLPFKFSQVTIEDTVEDEP